MAEKEEGQFTSMQLQADVAGAALRLAAHRDMAHRAGGGCQSDQKRDAWLRQFLFAFGNDEGEEATSFQGTIPQA